MRIRVFLLTLICSNLSVFSASIRSRRVRGDSDEQRELQSYVFRERKQRKTAKEAYRLKPRRGTLSPSYAPKDLPTVGPSHLPSETPTLDPSSAPTKKPTLKPTKSPTVKPTPRPTPEPTGSSGTPWIQFVEGKDNFNYKLGLCQGDCDNDSQCEEGMYCHQRGANDPVPHCAGGESEGSRTDYCTGLL